MSATPQLSVVVPVHNEEDNVAPLVGEIVAASTLSRTAVAHHLRVLRDAGVLRSEKIGREVWFWPDPAPIREALDAVGDYLRSNL